MKHRDKNFLCQIAGMIFIANLFYDEIIDLVIVKPYKCICIF